MGRLDHSPDVIRAVLRLAVAGVLIWGAATKLVGGARLAELAAVWGAAGVPQPQLLVTASIALQLVLALLLLLGLFTRAAGLLNGGNFALAAAVSGIFTAGANWWPFALLVLLLLYFGLLGGGRISLDALRARRLAGHGQSLEELLVAHGFRPSDGNHPGSG